MQRPVSIRLLGNISVQAEGTEAVCLSAKSRMGASLMEYLILQRGQPVPGERLIREMWTDRSGRNPENALKTMVSRLRSLLHDISVGLGDCVAFGPGGYYWQREPWVRVDVLDMLESLESLKGKTLPEQKAELGRVIRNYTGDLYNSGDISNGTALVNALHKRYLDAVYMLTDILRAEENWEEIYQVCASALRIDDADERLHMEAMNAMMRMHRMGEAMKEYRRIVRKTDPPDAPPPEREMQSSVVSLAETGRELRLNLEQICRELQERDRERKGPFFCDYAAFKEIYNIQMRNLERLGSTMFLGVIMVGGADSEISSVSRESAMAGLLEILRHNLRKGDIVTRFAPALVAMLLPTVNYSTGSMVMERIEGLFYREFPNGGVTVHHRISPLGSITV